MTMSDEEPNSTLWTAGGAADEFRSHQLRRAERRHIRRACLLILATILIVGVPGWMMYLKYQDARRQMLIDEFVSLRVALGKVKEATEIDRDVERIRTLHQPVGITLNETPWRSTSAVIEGKVRELNQRHVQISSLLDAGDVRESEERLATLLSEIGILQRDNVEALITSQTRQNWVRLNTSVPDRLKDDSELAVVRGIGANAEQGWEAGDWSNARALYGQASEHLQKFLESRLNSEEKGKLLASDAEAVARLETEKTDFAKQVESLRQEKQSLSDQLATTNGQRLSAENLSRRSQLNATH